MLIKSIDIENFRIFAGKQHIEFSTDANSNVTLIMGDNGAGKTTFAQAFSWCLYGTTTFKKQDELLSLRQAEQCAALRAVFAAEHMRVYRVGHRKNFLLPEQGALASLAGQPFAAGHKGDVIA